MYHKGGGDGNARRCPSVNALACGSGVAENFHAMPHPMSRWKAASIHLVASCVLALLAFLLLFFVWYPPPLFAAGGGDRLVVLLLSIDIVLGPLLTLVVFRSGKRGMRFDLTVIAVLQLSALAYGLHVMAVARPVWLVYAVDRFVAVSANAIDPLDAGQAPPEFRAQSWTGPRVVGAQLPEGDEAMTQLASAFAGKDIEQSPRYYVDYQRVRGEAVRRRKPLAGLAATNAAAVAAFVAKHGGAEADYGYLPLVARSRDVAAVVDGTGNVVGYIDAKPW